MMKIHHCWISESLKFFFLTEFGYGFDLTDMREKNLTLFVTWHWFCGSDPDLYSAQPYIGWHVAWISLRGILRTDLQFYEIWDWFAIKQIGLIWKLKELGLFWNFKKFGLLLKKKEKEELTAISWRFWTKMQFRKIFGLKCKINKIG